MLTLQVLSLKRHPQLARKTSLLSEIFVILDVVLIFYQNLANLEIRPALSDHIQPFVKKFTHENKAFKLGPSSIPPPAVHGEVIKSFQIFNFIHM